MRIISGTHKGRKISPPKGLPVRPTKDMAKEALFNILNNRYHFEDIKTLDLFAGTGNISLEFASRGVPEIVAVDADYKCYSFISKISKEFDFAIEVVKGDVLKFLDRTPQTFDLIFADPPYNFSVNDCEEIRSKVFNRELLNSNGLLIIEHSKHTDLSELPNFVENKKYGSSVFSFFNIYLV